VAARTSRQQYLFGIARLLTRQESYAVQQKAETKATKKAKALKATMVPTNRIREILRPGL
jgi:hypothetical protein